MALAHGEQPWRRPYGGYYNATRPTPDAELTRVGRGTPCGEYMRRFWQPVALSAEAAERPHALRILGENLVAFRDLSGRLGLLDRHCAHRGTSLEFAIPQQRGLRCCYHGWTYDIDGRCLETPGEPPHSKLKETMFQGAYPVREHGGLIFAYMGPPEHEPDFPLYDTLVYPAGNRMVPYVFEYPCNWLQTHENGADPAHLTFLHSLVSTTHFDPAYADLPLLDFIETPIGMVVLAMRRKGDNLWARVSDIIMPNSHQFSGVGLDGTAQRYALYSWATRWCVPIDDEHSLNIGIRHFNDSSDPLAQGRPESLGRNRTDLLGQVADRPYEERQRVPSDFEALTGQGPVAVHAAEHLGSTDKGVLMLRRMVRDGIRAAAKGAPFKTPRPAGRQMVPTYNVEVVHPVPRRDDGDDEALLWDFGHKVVEIALASDAVAPDSREAHITEAIAQAYPR